MLRLIENGGGDGGSERPFRKNKLSDALWRAIYPRPATSYTQIRKRMSDVCGSRLTFYQVNNCIYHVRHYAEQYGWTVAHVQKGRDGEMRKYFPVLTDGKIAVSDYEDYIAAGVKSSAATIATMAMHESIALDIVASRDDLSSGDKRLLRAASSMFTAASEMAKKVLAKVA